MAERLNKILAQHGIGSRREVERWIVEDRLKVNGKFAKLGDRYEEGDRVELDGRDITKRLLTNANIQVLAYHKPQGQLIERDLERDLERDSEDTTRDPDGVATSIDASETVMDRLPKQRGVRWVPINPMHAGDSGLLLLTNDGNLSYALTRQKKNIPTVYMVRVHVRGGVESAPTLPTRMLMDDQIIEFTSIEASGNEAENVWYKVTMPRADRRAAVRALFASHSLTVSRMMQVAFAGIELTKELPRSRHQALKPAQVDQLYQAAQLKRPDDKPRRSRTSAEDEEVKPNPRKDKFNQPATKKKQSRSSNRPSNRSRSSRK